MLFITDEIQNCAHIIINYLNNIHLRNLWYRYIDYCDINGIYDNSNILLYHTMALIILIYILLLSVLIYNRNILVSTSTLSLSLLF